MSETQRRALKLATVDLNPYVSEQLDERGFLFQILSETLAEAGYSIDIGVYPSLRAQELVANGKRDILMPAFQESGHSKKFAYSDPIFASRVARIKLKGHSLPSKPKLGTARDAFYEFPREIQHFYVETERTSQLIDMLDSGRIDLLLGDRLVVADTLIRKRPRLVKKLEFIEEQHGSRDLRVAFSRRNPNWEKALKDFNQALARIKADGRYAAILARFGFEKPQPKLGRTISIALPPNADMQSLKSLSQEFLRTQPGVNLDFHFMPENFLRRRTFMSMAFNEDFADIFSLGPTEVALYAKHGWVSPLRPKDPRYQLDDIFPQVREGLSLEGELFALPFYSESSMTYYRKDLFAKHRLVMPEQPTWSEIRTMAKALHAPEQGRYGICLRGKKGSKMLLLATMIHSFGGQFFDTDWQPQFTAPKFREAVGFYLDLMKNFGPPDPASKTYLEALDLFAEGHCAIWVDATVAASQLMDTGTSKVSDKVAFVRAPIRQYTEGAQWLYTWALSLSSRSKQKSLALKFMQWATSSEYVSLVAKRKGWMQVPPGTRISTYNSAYRREAPFATAVYKAISGFRPLSLRVPNTSYRETRYVDAPEWSAVVGNLDLHLTAALQGKETLDFALEQSEREARDILYKAGYYRAISRR